MQATRRRMLGGAAGLAAAGGFPAIVRAQPRITLKLSHYLPPTHGLHTDFMEPWAQELEQKTQGAVSVQISPGTSALGQAANQLDQCRNGIVDIAGPERAPLAEFAARFLRAVGDSREVVSDPEARYYGGRVEEQSLVPLGDARLGTIGLEEWLRRQPAKA